MPVYKWTCPRDTCKASWTTTREKPPYGQRSKCNCGVVTVPLQCYFCPAQFVSQPDERLGGKNIKCSKCAKVFTVPVSEMELRERFQEYKAIEVDGEKGRFSQSQRAASLTTELQETVKGGYCEGVCIDWIRRVVQGGHSTFLVALKDKHTNKDRSGEEIKTREAQQTRRGAQAWVTRYKAPKDNFFAADQKKYDDIFAAVKKAKDDAYKEYGKLFDECEKVLWDYNHATTAQQQTLIEPKYHQAEKAADDANLKWKDLQTQAENLVSSRNAEVKKHELDRFWSTYAKLMDDFVAKERQLQKRDPSGRTFSSLKIVSSVPLVEHGSAANGVRALLDDKEFLPSRAACLGFGSYKEKSGHAIAIQRLNTGTNYHLLDPNLGTFEFNRDNLINAVALLFTSYYEGYTSNSASNGKTKTDYCIFAADK